MLHTCKTTSGGEKGGDVIDTGVQNLLFLKIPFYYTALGIHCKSKTKDLLALFTHDTLLTEGVPLILVSDLDELSEESSREKHVTLIVWALSFTRQ